VGIGEAYRQFHFKVRALPKTYVTGNPRRVSAHRVLEGKQRAVREFGNVRMLVQVRSEPGRWLNS
jgi:hypothetical protein